VGGGWWGGDGRGREESLRARSSEKFGLVRLTASPATSKCKSTPKKFIGAFHFYRISVLLRSLLEHCKEFVAWMRIRMSDYTESAVGWPYDLHY
jgi:hypothetical protein